jgi:hypothetical protein
MKEGWLLDRLDGHFQLLAIGIDVPMSIDVGGVLVHALIITDVSNELQERYDELMLYLNM